MSAEIRSLAVTLLALAMLGVGPAVAASRGDRGTASGLFLRLSRTAREAAMGDVGTGATGPAAVGRNPAAMGGASGILAGRNESAGGAVNVDQVSAARPVARGWFAGAAALHVSGGSIEQTDDNGEAVGGFTPRDLAATLAVARSAGRFSAGLSVSLLHSKIIHTAHVVTVGLGAEWRSVDGKYRAGLYGTNLAGRLRYVDDSAPLPREVRLGVERRFRRIGVVGEVASPNDGDAYASGGLEASLGDGPWQFFFRGGYDGRRARGRDGANGIALGMGMAAGVWSLDYAWVPGGDIGDDHLVTVGYRFRPSSASVPTESNRPRER